MVGKHLKFQKKVSSMRCSHSILGFWGYLALESDRLHSLFYSLKIFLICRFFYLTNPKWACHLLIAIGILLLLETCFGLEIFTDRENLVKIFWRVNLNLSSQKTTLKTETRVYAQWTLLSFENWVERYPKENNQDRLLLEL